MTKTAKETQITTADIFALVKIGVWLLGRSVNF